MCIYHIDSSAPLGVYLKSSYIPTLTPLPPTAISFCCSFLDHLKVFSCLLSGHAVHAVLIWLSHKESPTGITDTFLSYRYRYICTCQRLLDDGRETLVIIPNCNELLVLMGIKFNYHFPKNLQQCDGYSYTKILFNWHNRKGTSVSNYADVLGWHMCVPQIYLVFPANFF